MGDDDAATRQLLETQIRANTRAAFMKRAMVLVVILSYATVLNELLSVYACSVLYENGNYVLIADERLQCWDALHSGLIAFATLFLILLASLPFGIYFVLRRYAAQNMLQDKEVQSTYGSLYEVYVPDMPWFDSIVLLRRFLMMMVTTAFSSYIPPLGLVIINLGISLIYAALVSCFIHCSSISAAACA
jgi:hypothetical protein